MRNDLGRTRARIAVVGVPGSRRVLEFARAADRAGIARIEVVSYVDVMAERWSPSPGTVVRLESPSPCAATTRALLKAGLAPLGALGGNPLSEREIDQLACERGAVVPSRQWFLGFRETLVRLEERWRGHDLSWMAHPHAIVTAFDKQACLDLWASAGLTVPQQFRGIASYSQLRDAIPGRHGRVFVKLRYGYSAMGAVALEWRDTRVRAITTVDLAHSEGRSRMFVTKRPHVVTSEHEVAWLIDALGNEEIIVERWLPKARWNSRPYDLRVVVIEGRMRHVVGRANSSPFTNLNLDAARVPREVVESHLGESWPDLESQAQHAAMAIPDATMLGLDVLVRPSRREFVFLEANAFGDYLPGLLDQGESTYDAQLRAAGLAATGAPA